MTRIRLWMWGVVALFAASYSVSASAQDLGCDSAVALNGGTIQVSPVSGDDTANIQCALGAAARDGYRDVFLSGSAYEIGTISVTGFVGDLRGVSKAGTTVTIPEKSVSCESLELLGFIQFVVGNAAVRNMTITTGDPCQGSEDFVALIAFISDSGNCSVNRTAFGNVDRVTMQGGGVFIDDTIGGVVMRESLQCSATELGQKVLGTLKVNRSDFSALDFGVLSSVGGGGQVDINFNTFKQMGQGIVIANAAQNTSIVGNNITYNDVTVPSGVGSSGVVISSDTNSPADNSTVIKGSNAFTDAGQNPGAVAIAVVQDDKTVNHSLSITSNTFTSTPTTPSSTAIRIVNTSNGIISSNSFSGSVGNSWVLFRSGDPANNISFAPTVSGWAVVGNSFPSATGASDIAFEDNTAGNVVGRDQGPPTVTGSTLSANNILGGSGS